jgi:hypothetical protein
MNRQIIWSPQLNDKPWFVIGGGDLRLYEYSQQDKRDIFTLLHTNSDLSLMKCISWAKTSSYNDLMGIGMSNGRAVVQSLTYPSEFNVSFVPRHARACNAVDFSPDSSLLVTGLEKVRNDYSLSLWNIEKVEIINQYGPSETISSLSFFEGYPNLLVAGMNGKWIRIYDTRTPGNCFVLSSKAVNGISIDPFFYTQFSSFTDDGLIKIYDFRNSSGEILSINTNESRIGLESIAYSKDRKGLITCLTKDSNFIRLYDVKTGETSTEIIEPIFNNPDNNSNVPNVPTGNFDSDLWRSRASNCLSFTISSYCFIPGLNSFLAIGNSGPIIEKIQIVEPCKLSWGGYGCAILSDNETPGGIDILDNCILSPLEISDEISIIMINRAKKGYCLDSSVNQTLVSGGLKEAWCWLERMASLSEQGRLFIGNTDFSYQGISSILLQAWTLASSKRSGATQTLWNSSSPSSSLPKYVPSESILSPNDYLSTNIQRAVALDLINLPFRNLDHWILQLVDQKSYYKAAAWALFSSNFSLCIESLKASPTDSDKMISACIISYSLNSSSFSSSSMWNDICSSISKESKDPYIRAMFTFIGSSGNLHLVLEEKDLPLIDKISIALYFLDDKNVLFHLLIQMITFLTKLTNRVILLGDIEGLVLTGFSFPHSIDLLQNYLDNTGDIQTISAFSCHFPPKLFKFINLESVNVKASSKQKEWIET